MSLGSNIKKFRRELGLTQEELANILCVTGQAVSKWESENGLPDTAQIVPLANALNVSTDALFGFATETYDKAYARQINFEANTIRDTGNQTEAAKNCADFLNQKCEENIFNYGILTKYVQSIAHLSRFADTTGIGSNLFGDEPEKWQRYVKLAENRAAQVIRYSGERELNEKCHFALAWLYWHEHDYGKGREHLEALPSISSNMLQESINSYYASIETGLDGWRESVRGNFQNYVRAMNKQFVYTAESAMWAGSLEEVERTCFWAISVMDDFCKNEQMKPFCQGFYRDVVKYLAAAYLRNKMPEKAAEQWNMLKSKTDDYLVFCDKLNQANRKDDLIKQFGEKGAENIGHYNKDYVESKRAFMLGQLKSWSDGEVFAKFEKLI